MLCTKSVIEVSYRFIRLRFVIHRQYWKSIAYVTLIIDLLYWQWKIERSLNLITFPVTDDASVVNVAKYRAPFSRVMPFAVSSHLAQLYFLHCFIPLPHLFTLRGTKRSIFRYTLYARDWKIPIKFKERKKREKLHRGMKGMIDIFILPICQPIENFLVERMRFGEYAESFRWSRLFHVLFLVRENSRASRKIYVIRPSSFDPWKRTYRRVRAARIA